MGGPGPPSPSDASVWRIVGKGDRLPPPALAGEETGRGRRYQRPPREPPRPPPAPRRSPPPLPGDFAFSTRIVRPSRFVPFRRLMACSASSGVAISTNPKPRERPVSRSVTTLRSEEHTSELQSRSDLVCRLL